MQFDDGDVDHEAFDDLEDDDDDDDLGLFYLYLSRKLSPTVEDSLANGFRFLMDFWFSAFSERLQKARQLGTDVTNKGPRSSQALPLWLENVDLYFLHSAVQ